MFTVLCVSFLATTDGHEIPDSQGNGFLMSTALVVIGVPQWDHFINIIFAFMNVHILVSHPKNLMTTTYQRSIRYLMWLGIPTRPHE